jgi:hypothetical protein
VGWAGTPRARRTDARSSGDDTGHAGPTPGRAHGCLTITIGCVVIQVFGGRGARTHGLRAIEPATVW